MSGRVMVLGDTVQVESTAPTAKLSFYQAAFQRLLTLRANRHYRNDALECCVTHFAVSARTPRMFACAVVCLAGAIGTATAVFAIVNGVVLRPLPFQHAIDSSRSGA